MSNALLSTMFNMSVAATQRSISTARNALTKHFTPNYIGFNHITRDEIIQHHTRQLAITLFGGHEDPAILVLDGTYFYIQKSSQFHFQRNVTISIKTMMVVSTTGHIISSLGPYFSDGKNNDANILIHSLKTNAEDMSNWLREGDIVVVDRGFGIPLNF